MSDTKGAASIKSLGGAKDMHQEEQVTVAKEERRGSEVSPQVHKACW